MQDSASVSEDVAMESGQLPRNTDGQTFALCLACVRSLNGTEMGE